MQKPDWQLFIAGVVDDALAEQSPKQLLKIRTKLYELLSNCIPPDLIMRTLVRQVRCSCAFPLPLVEREPSVEQHSETRPLCSDSLPHASQLLTKLPIPVRMETLHHAALYEHRMRAGSKPIFHIEAFLARFMSCYKKYAVANFGK